MWQSLHCWCVFRMNKVPYIKFICRTVSHFFFLLLLILTGRNSQCWWSYQAWMFQPAFPSTRSRTVQPLCRSGTSGCCSVSLPSQYSPVSQLWSPLCSVWVSGLLLTELTTVGERTGVGLLKWDYCLARLHPNIMTFSPSDRSSFSSEPWRLAFTWRCSWSQLTTPTSFSTWGISSWPGHFSSAWSRSLTSSSSTTCSVRGPSSSPAYLLIWASSWRSCFCSSLDSRCWWLQWTLPSIN